MKSTIACRLFSATILFFTGCKKDKNIIIHCGGGCFFYRKGPRHDIFKLSVDRGYWKTVGEIQLAGRGIWECYTGCTDVVNDEYFRILSGESQPGPGTIYPSPYFLRSMTMKKVG